MLYVVTKLLLLTDRPSLCDFDFVFDKRLNFDRNFDLCRRSSCVCYATYCWQYLLGAKRERISYKKMLEICFDCLRCLDEAKNTHYVQHDAMQVPIYCSAIAGHEHSILSCLVPKFGGYLYARAFRTKGGIFYSNRFTI